MLHRISVALLLVLVACPPPPPDGEGEGDAGEGEGDAGEGEGEVPCDDSDDTLVDDLPASFLFALDSWAPRCMPDEDPETWRNIEPNLERDLVPVLSFDFTADGRRLNWRQRWRHWRAADANPEIRFHTGRLRCLEQALLADEACTHPARHASRPADVEAGGAAVRAGRGGACCSTASCSGQLHCTNGVCVDPPPPACIVDDDCPGGTCRGGRCLLDDGAPCSRSDACLSQVCAHGVCGADRSDVGGSCASTNDCEAPLLCVAGTCSAGALDDGCSADAHCQHPLRCSAGRCGDVPASTSCQTFTSRMQVRCGIDGRCVDNACVKIPLGTVCSLDAHCANDAFCDVFSGTCVPLRERGEPASYHTPDPRCRPGLNVDGVCADERDRPFNSAFFPCSFDKGLILDEVTGACRPMLVVDDGPCGGAPGTEPMCRNTFSTRECIYDDLTSTSSCGNRRQLGETCRPEETLGSGASCALGLDCDLSGTSGVDELGVCVALPGPGEPAALNIIGCDTRVAWPFAGTCVALDDYPFQVADFDRCLP